MADSKRISDLTTTEAITENDLIEESSFVSEGEYASRKASLGSLGLALLNDFNYEALNTTAKKIIGAVNEVKDAVTNVTVIKSQNLSITIDGETRNITFKLYSNGMKSIQYGFANTTSSEHRLTGLIPSDYLPESYTPIIGSTWSDQHVRRAVLYVNGDVVIYQAATGEKGAYAMAFYV